MRGDRGLTVAERFARYLHQPSSWADREFLDDWHRERARWYEVTRSWAERNRDRWPGWFDVCTPAQRRRLRKVWRRSMRP